MSTCSSFLILTRLWTSATFTVGSVGITFGKLEAPVRAQAGIATITLVMMMQHSEPSADIPMLRLQSNPSDERVDEIGFLL